jgi:hypothetical protein
LLRGSGGLLFDTVGVGLIDGGLEQGLQPAERHCTQRWCDPGIHDTGLLGGEVAGGGGDVAGLIGRQLPRQHSRPHQFQPVPQIQRIGHQPRSGTVGDP